MALTVRIPSCPLSPGSGYSGSFPRAASVFGEGLRRQNWPYFLRIVCDPREVPRLNLTGQNQLGCGNAANLVAGGQP